MFAGGESAGSEILKYYYSGSARYSQLAAQRWMMPRRTAIVIAWVRSLAPNLAMMCWM